MKNIGRFISRLYNPQQTFWLYTWDEAFSPDAIDIHTTVVESSQFYIDLVCPIDIYPLYEIWKEKHTDI
jgi:hypothetical protein